MNVLTSYFILLTTIWSSNIIEQEPNLTLHIRYLALPGATVWTHSLEDEVLTTEIEFYDKNNDRKIKSRQFKNIETTQLRRLINTIDWSIIPDTLVTSALDGTTCEIEIKLGGIEKKVYLDNYYHSDIDSVIKLTNDLIPRECLQQKFGVPYGAMEKNSKRK